MQVEKKEYAPVSLAHCAVDFFTWMSVQGLFYEFFHLGGRPVYRPSTVRLAFQVVDEFFDIAEGVGS